MLKLEYLLEEAKNNGLPLIKKRGVLREYIQVIILNSLFKHNSSKSMFFTGGTAMRFFYNMPRFSEDLDFDARDLSFNDFIELSEYIKKGLIKEGFSLEISSEERGNVFSAEFRFKDVMKIYEITDKRGIDLMIKIDVYKPSWNLKSESDVLSLYGYNFSSVLLEKGLMFSEKIAALINRGRGRDIYDTLFMLRNKFPYNKDVLTANKITGSFQDIILNHFRNLSEKELKFLANQVKPFLFKEEDIELVLKPVLYAEKFLEKY